VRRRRLRELRRAGTFFFSRDTAGPLSADPGLLPQSRIAAVPLLLRKRTKDRAERAVLPQKHVPAAAQTAKRIREMLKG